MPVRVANLTPATSLPIYAFQERTNTLDLGGRLKIQWVNYGVTGNCFASKVAAVQ